MSYKCYLFGELMPQTPAKLSVKINGKSNSVTLLNEGEISFLRYPGLTDISLSLVFPMFTADKPPDYYLSLLEYAKTSRRTTRFLLTRTSPNGMNLFDTNFKVSVEDYTITENASNGLDVSVDIKLKQYRDYETKTLKLDPASLSAEMIGERPSESAPQTSVYTVKPGDTLWGIAKTYYGNGADYMKIYEANKDTVKNPNLIYEGQVLNIP